MQPSHREPPKRVTPRPRAERLPRAAAVGAALVLASCAPRPSPSGGAWHAIDAAARQERLTRTPFLDPRIIRFGRGQIEFVAVIPSASAASAPAADAETGAAGPGEATVYIHGLGGTLGDFAPLLLGSGSGRPSFAMNLPGTGRSTHEDHDYTIRSHAAVLEEILVRRMGLAQVDLVCHSLGGQVCLAFAFANPSRLSSLVLIDAAGVYDQAEFVGRMAKSYGKVNLGNILVGNHPGIAVLTGGNQDFLKRLVGGKPSLLSALDSFNQNFRDRLGGLAVPVLLVWGERDPLFPVQNGFFLLSNLKDARLRVVPGAGHVPQLSHPETVRAWITEFHASLGPRPSED